MFILPPPLRLFATDSLRVRKRARILKPFVIDSKRPRMSSRLLRRSAESPCVLHSRKESVAPLLAGFAGRNPRKAWAWRSMVLAGPMGRARPILRRMSHITVVLGPDVPPQDKKSKKKGKGAKAKAA